jgi:YbbR domain-containing protein
MMKFVRNLVTRNRGLKLFSFLLAFVLWLILIPEEKTYSERTLAVPLETRNIPADMELVEKPPGTIDVTVRASNRFLNEISPASVSARLDLERASIYQEMYPLNASVIVVPQGAEVVGVSPNMVRLKLEKTRQMDLEVAPMVVGKVREGFRIAKIEITPARVPVKGPESKIRTRDRLTTSPIDVSGLALSATLEADIILPRPDLRLATPLTRVRVDITLEKDERTSNGKDAGAR